MLRQLIWLIILSQRSEGKYKDENYGQCYEDFLFKESYKQ